MAATGLESEAARAHICRALSDGAIQIRVKLGKHTSSPMRPPERSLEGSLFIPMDLKPEDLDWANSRPTEAWKVPREAYRPPGYWHLDWIELFRADVTNVLCEAAAQSAPARQISDQPATATPDRSGTADIGCSESTVRNPSVARLGRRRGRRPLKLETTKEAMRRDIQAGRVTIDGLTNMFEKNLSEDYGVSRDTARKARDAVLSELS